jgi:integrase
MASILPINGRWRVQIRRPGRKSISQTFDSKLDAERWAREVEGTGVSSDDVTVGYLIQQFRSIRSRHRRPVKEESNTHYMLEHLEADLGHERVSALTSDRLAAWATYRHEQGAGGYTVNMELSQLGTVLRHAASFLKLTLPDVVGQARPALWYMQLISGGKKRVRRPTEDELRRVLPSLKTTYGPAVADAVELSSIVGLRRSELTRIAWPDVDEKRRMVLVRARKHPRQVEARDEWVPLLGRAFDLVMRQPRDDVRIFPLSNEKLTDAVTETTKRLGIPDLHLHDMRRNATSSLREMGFDQHERKAIVGHRSDEAHELYLSVTPESVHKKYKDLQAKRRRKARR